MNRKFKALGLVLASVFAMSAVGAPAASAADFFSEVTPQTISGSQTTTHVFTTNAGTVSCKKATFSGAATNGISETQTLAPDYSECTAFGFINVPVHENGCAYVFNANGTTEVECPSGKKIEITAPFCTTTVGPQHLASGMSFANNAGETDIVATTNISSSIDYNECGTERTNGSYTGTTTVTGASGSIWYSAEATRVKAPVPDCTFAKVGDPCEIEIEAKKELEIKSSKFKGEKAAERYEAAVGCTAKKVLKAGEACTDVIKAKKIEAKTENEWCITIEPKGKKAFEDCTKLTM